MTFSEIYDKCEPEKITEMINSYSVADVAKVLLKDKINKDDFAALLSPAAGQFLEEMAVKAKYETLRNFGRTIQLYTPMYISSYCSNKCAYCGFSSENHITRKKLSYSEIEAEAKAISETGLKHILFLTGEAPEVTPMEYLIEAVKILGKYFSNISTEVFPLSEEEYKRLHEMGVEGVTVYQETYDKDVYSKVHLKGKKQDFYYRLNTPDRSAAAGMRNVNIGALFGLASPMFDAYMAGIHAEYLMNQYPETEISLSLPRINKAEGGFVPNYFLDDRYFVQLMLAYRLFLPKVGITISTRENKEFRDNLIGICATKFSADSRTNVGGHTCDDNDGQFDISDKRSLEEFVRVVKAKGYDAVYKDWEPIFGRINN